LARIGELECEGEINAYLRGDEQQPALHLGKSAEFVEQALKSLSEQFFLGCGVAQDEVPQLVKQLLREVHNKYSSSTHQSPMMDPWRSLQSIWETVAYDELLHFKLSKFWGEYEGLISWAKSHLSRKDVGQPTRDTIINRALDRLFKKYRIADFTPPGLMTFWKITVKWSCADYFRSHKDESGPVPDPADPHCERNEMEELRELIIVGLKEKRFGNTADAWPLIEGYVDLVFKSIESDFRATAHGAKKTAWQKHAAHMPQGKVYRILAAVEKAIDQLVEEWHRR